MLCSDSSTIASFASGGHDRASSSSPNIRGTARPTTWKPASVMRCGCGRPAADRARDDRRATRRRHRLGDRRLHSAIPRPFTGQSTACYARRTLRSKCWWWTTTPGRRRLARWLDGIRICASGWSTAAGISVIRSRATWRRQARVAIGCSSSTRTRPRSPIAWARSSEPRPTEPGRSVRRSYCPTGAPTRGTIPCTSQESPGLDGSGSQARRDRSGESRPSPELRCSRERTCIATSAGCARASSCTATMWTCAGACASRARTCCSAPTPLCGTSTRSIEARRKWYWLERNRLWTVLSNYSGAVLWLLAPLLIGAELRVLVLAIRGRWVRALLRAWGSTLLGIPELRRWRRFVQAGRRVRDSELLELMSGHFETAQLHDPVVATINPAIEFLRRGLIGLLRAVNR